MVKLALQLKATLENLTDLRPGPDFIYFVKVKCGSCREEHPNAIIVDPKEYRPLSGSRGEANMVWRCSFCKREHSANYDEAVKNPPYTKDNSDDQVFVSIAVFECRGCEFTAFQPNDGWSCKGLESNTVFEDIDLSDGEWVEYDEKANEPVSVMSVETRISRV